MPKVFRDLSILVGEVESGTLVYVDSPNYDLLCQATQTIKSLLSRMICPSHMSHNMEGTSGNQGLGHAGSEDMANWNGENWGLWDDSGFYDFEMNFWHGLAAHPFLNA